MSNDPRHGPEPEPDALTPGGTMPRDAEIEVLRHELEEARAQHLADKSREFDLRGELQHRVRNMLGVVRSIFERSQMASRTMEELSNHFQGRLDVIGRYQLSHSHADGLTYDLETIIHDELLTLHASADQRIDLRGPTVNLAPQAGLVMGLVLHELATNSMKFGVLSSPNERGQISVRWSLASDLFEFRWEESGISIISSAPMRTGFGRDYLESAVPYQLGGTSRFTLDPGGVTYRCALPASAILADGALRSFWIP